MLANGIAGQVTRTHNYVDYTPTSHLFVDGIGHVRDSLNSGQPDVLNANRSGATVSGAVHGVARFTNIKGSPDWFSIRSIGAGEPFTVYVKRGALVVMDGAEHKVEDFI
jgi:hypothetical protein